jgi:IS605 OrfB family transposase
MEAIKTVTLNLLEPTRRKQQEVQNLTCTYREAMRFVISQVDTDAGTPSQRKLQEQFYDQVKAFGLHSQHACSLFRDVRPILKNGGTVKKVAVPFNIPRSGAFARTRSGNPVVTMATLNGSGRIALPVAMDGAYRRYEALRDEGYTTTFFRLNGSRIHVTLKKEAEIAGEYGAVLGIDVGSKRLAAVSVVGIGGRILRQLYFGQDVGDRQRDISLRRSKLRSHADRGSRYARQALRRLKRKEHNFTTTRCWQVAHQVVELATEFDACIAMEDLNGLNEKKLNRKGNRKVRRIPFRRFQQAVESVARQKGIRVEYVPREGTSQHCSRCGAKGTRRKGYFRCQHCGYEANADRNASVNIALGAGLFGKTKTQTPGGNLPVNAGDRVHDGIPSGVSDATRCPTHAHGFRRGQLTLNERFW